MVLAMPGVDGLGQRALAGSPGPTDPSLAASLNHLGMQVTPENVLHIRAALLTEADRLDVLLQRHYTSLGIRAPAPDPVSEVTETVLNPKIDGLTDQFKAYVGALKAAGAVLAGTAQGYGYTEQQITDSFKALGQDSASEGMPR